jgi:hypothetical protein
MQAFVARLKQLAFARDGEGLARLITVAIPPAAVPPGQAAIGAAGQYEHVSDAAWFAPVLGGPQYPPVLCDLAAAYAGTACALHQGRWRAAFDAARRGFDAFADALSRADGHVWYAPALRGLLYAVRALAIRCDREDPPADDSDVGRIGDAVVAIARATSNACRAPAQCPLHAAAYLLVNDLLRLCYVTRSFELADGVLRRFDDARGCSPELELGAVPRSQSVKFQLLFGTQMLIRGDFQRADEALLYAFEHARAGAAALKRVLLARLVPVAVLARGKLPSRRLLDKYGLSQQYGGLVQAISRGDVAAFDVEVQRNAAFYAKVGSFIAVERVRVHVWRNLARRVYEATGRQSKMRISMVVVAARILAERRGLPVATSAIDGAEAECALANCMFEKLILGYIALSHGVIVYSEKSYPFPRPGAVGVTPRQSPEMR